MNPDRKVAVLHYLNNLSSTYSGFENTCIFPQRLLTLVDSENFGGNIVDVSSIIRTDDTDKYQMMDCRILGTASIKGLLLNVAWYIQFKLRITFYSIFFVCHHDNSQCQKKEEKYSIKYLL